ncbi:MAG TPA: uroporphyrinogen-III synthase, partial [Smithellaceae bacterium]|nr:uroporphyrinogen-III synthase [Smithellaceae bacterium]
EGKDIKVDLVPDEFIAEGILKSFSALDVRGKRFLLPRAAKARDILPEGLKKMGAMVDVVKTYRTVNSGRKKEEFMTLLEARAVDVITFTSSSTVEKFVEIMGKDFVVPPQVRVACIGPVTASTAKKAGFQVDIEQKEYTMQGLVQALIDYNKQMLS